MITGGRDGVLNIWNYNNGHCLRKLMKRKSNYSLVKLNRCYHKLQKDQTGRGLAQVTVKSNWTWSVRDKYRITGCNFIIQSILATTFIFYVNFRSCQFPLIYFPIHKKMIKIITTAQGMLRIMLEYILITGLALPHCCACPKQGFIF